MRLRIPKSMKSLRTRLVTVVAVSLLSLFAVQFTMARSVLLQGFTQLESDKTRIQVESARSLLNDQLQQLSGVVSDWANWDDTYEYMAAPSQRYITSNYTDDTFDHLKVNAILLADTNGEIVYQRGFDFVRWQAWRIPPAVVNALGGDGLLSKPSSNGNRYGIMAAPDGALLVAAADILPSGGKGERRGVMVMVRRLDQSLINQIGAIVGARVSIVRADGDTLLAADLHKALAGLAPGNSARVFALNEREVGGFVLINELGSNAELLLRTVSGRSIHEQGESSLNFMLYSTSAMAALLALITWLFDKLILTRLTSLSQSLGRIGDSVAGAARVEDVGGDDELSSLADGINSMLDRLTESQHSVRELTTEMSYQARHDALTGLINRYEFDRLVQDAVEDAHHVRRSHCIAYIDLDEFKVINDSCGHMVGDSLLKQLADHMRAQLRESDALARLGGDEFALLLMGCDLDVARRVCEKLLQSVRSFPFVHGDKGFKLTASIGLTEINDRQQAGLNELLSAMDAACYAAKEEGGNRLHVYQPDDQELSQRISQLEWVSRIHHALDHNQFRVYWQRMATLSHGLGLHCEMLIRLQDDDGTVFAPGYFLPVAERYQLMSRIDRWMVREVLAILAEKGDAFPYVCAINLSGQSFSDDGFMDFVIDQIRQKGIDPSRICFEITETAVISNLSRARFFIESLKALGCSFSLDDFGSGLSSFGYLKNLNVDYLKIDGMFIRNLTANSVDRAMVEAINHVGHVMHLHTIAEFAETPEAIELLREMGVDYAQGYGVAKPEPFKI